MMRWFIGGAAAVALVAAGLVHGYWTDRWVANQDTEAAKGRLTDIPLVIGDWKGEDLENASQPPGVAGALQRRYTNQRLGATVVISLVNGQPGPVATHTPEVCYGAAGFEVGERKSVRLDTNDLPAQFWTADAVKSSVTEEKKIRMYWAWNGGQAWIASEDARRQFPRFRHPVLHKLYVLRDLNGSGAVFSDRDDPCVTFLHVLLPALDQALFPKG